MTKIVCCRVCRPRYKQLVRAALPRNAVDGLNPTSMEKLYYYSLLYPEKMDQVGEYMHERAAKHLRKGRFAHVALSMDALAQLLSTADPRGREQIVDSFLRTVLMCLASRTPRLQITATYCFIRFVILKDETLYHLNYEQLLTEFADMCHNTIEDTDVQEEVRHAGIEGLEAILLWCDGLIDNIYSFTYMNVILPCLLFNLNDPEYLSMTTAEREEYSMNSPGIAESCMKEVLVRTYASRLHYVLDPILNYFDENDLWWDSLFPFEVFKLVVLSVEPTYAYVLIERLVKHASYEETEDALTRVRILETVMEISQGTSTEAVGPSAFYCVGQLLDDLEKSVRRSALESGLPREDEEGYQDAVVRTLETISFALPDFYKLEMMVFVVNRTPFPSQGLVDATLRYILLDLLGEVSKQYITSHFTSTLPMNLLRPLLRISLSPNPKVRLAVHNVIHNLIDRHKNVDKLKEPTSDIASLDLVIETCTALDVAFMRRNALEIFHALYEGFECFNNSARNVNAVFTSSALFIIEAATETTLIETLRFLINIQDLAVERARTWLWRGDLTGVVESLLSVLLRMVPAAGALKEQAAAWEPPPPALLPIWVGAGSFLHRPRVVYCLRSDGWEGVTEQHLSAYAGTRASVWPQRVTTVMRVSVTPPSRSLAGLMSARIGSPPNPTQIVVVPSSSSMREGRNSRLLPPVPPRTVEQEHRWLFLNDVLMLNPEDDGRGDDDVDLDEFSDSQEGTVGEKVTRPGSLLEEEEEDEENEDESSLSSEDESSLSTSSDYGPTLKPILTRSSSTILPSDERPTPSQPAVTVSADHVVSSVAPGDDDKRAAEKVESPMERPITVPFIAPCGRSGCSRKPGPIAPCGKGPCTNTRAKLYTPTKDASPGATDLEASIEPSPPVTPSPADGRIQGVRPTSRPSSRSASRPTSARSASADPFLPLIASSTVFDANQRLKDCSTKVSESSNEPFFEASAAISSSLHRSFSAEASLSGSCDSRSAPATAEPVPRSRSPRPLRTLKSRHRARPRNAPSTSLEAAATRKETAHDASQDSTESFQSVLDPRESFAAANRASTAPAGFSPTLGSGLNRWYMRSTGASIIARLKADASITVAHQRLKFTEKQARIRMHYRTKPFEQLRPARRRSSLGGGGGGGGGLQATLAGVLRDVPPPPPPPTGRITAPLLPIRSSLLHFIQDDINDVDRMAGLMDDDDE